MLASCATIVNDANVPVSISLSDGSDGECKLTNKRVSLSGKVPSTFMVRRSDDSLRIECTSESGKRGMFRRQGLAKKLLSIVEEKTKIKPTPQDPISPLGEKLFKVSKQDIN